MINNNDDKDDKTHANDEDVYIFFRKVSLIQICSMNIENWNIDTLSIIIYYQWKWKLRVFATIVDEGICGPKPTLKIWTHRNKKEK